MTRDDAREFARRTLANLDYIGRAQRFTEEVHLVTQLANSLLGLVVFPFEKEVIGPIELWTLARWREKGWPCWQIHQDEDKREETTTLGRLAYHLRNAIAHRRLRFSSDSPDLSKVTFYAHDALTKTSPPYWRASINGKDLLAFCRWLALSIDDELK
jgi:hypothetical protein